MCAGSRAPCGGRRSLLVGNKRYYRRVGTGKRTRGDLLGGGAPFAPPERAGGVEDQRLRRRAARAAPASAITSPPRTAAISRASTRGARTSAKTRLIRTVWV